MTERRSGLCRCCGRETWDDVCDCGTQPQYTDRELRDAHDDFESKNELENYRGR